MTDLRLVLAAIEPPLTDALGTGGAELRTKDVLTQVRAAVFAQARNFGLGQMTLVVRTKVIPGTFVDVDVSVDWRDLI